MIPAALIALALAAAPTKTEQAAALLYEEGRKSFAAGDYAAALRLFQSAYDASKLPGFLFNVALAHRMLGACQPALDAYRQYLAEEPKAPNRDQVEARIEEMRACVEKEQPAVAAPQAEPLFAPPPPAPAPPPPEIVEPAPRGSIAGPIVSGAVAVAAGLGGTVLYVSAGSAFGRFSVDCAPRCEPSAWMPDLARERAGIGLWIAAGTVAAAALLWFLLR